MSYDIYLKINTGKKDVDVCDCGNYTYNCGEMFSDASGLFLSGLDGKPVREVIPILEKGILKIILFDSIIFIFSYKMSV